MTNRLFIVVLLSFFYVFGQCQHTINPSNDLDNPRNTITTHLEYFQQKNYDEVRASKTIYGPQLTEKEKIQKAKKLKQILDSRGLFVDINLVPDNPNHLDSSKSKHIYVLFKSLPEVYVEKIDGKWYYSRTTVSHIDKLFKDTFFLGSSFLMNLLPEAIGDKDIVGLKVWQWTGIFLLLFLGFFAYLVLSYINLAVINRILRSRISGVIGDENAGRAAARILSWFIVVFIIKLFVPSLILPVKVAEWTINLINVMLIVFGVMFVNQLILIASEHFARIASKTESTMDNQLVPLVRKLLQMIVWAVGIVFALQAIEINVVPLIAGLSIGGLAIALAAQDTVKNFIGSIVIFVDSPFQIGDWIEVDGINGIVEEVGVRSTRVRTFANSLSYFPNGKLADSIINNWGLRVYRRYNTTLGLTYDTPPELIEKYVEGLREIVKHHPTTRKDYYEIHLNSFGASSLNIMVYVFFEAPDWTEELRGKHELILAFIRLANTLGVQFAFPTQTLQVENLPGQEATKYNTDPKEVDKRVNDFIEEFKEREKNIVYPEKFKPLGGE